MVAGKPDQYLAIPTIGEVAVYRLGLGPKFILALPGFDQEAVALLGLGDHLTPACSLLIMDLPFHGQTHWQKDQVAAPDIVAVLMAVIQHYAIEELSLMGHSLGARMLLKALPLYLKLADRLPIQNLWLIAPDGIGGTYTNKVDYLPGLMVRPLAAYLQRPRGLLALARQLKKIGWLDRFSVRYLERQLRNQTSRNRLSGTLRSIPNLQLGAEADKSLIEIAKIEILLGMQDRLVQAARIRRWFLRIPQTKITNYAGGHGIPLKQLADLINAS